MQVNILDELKKCKEDPIYFICNYIKVIHPVRGLVNFNLYEFQKKIINDLGTHRFNILRKFRQAGCTTIAAAYSLWFTMFHSHKTVAILSKGDAEATEVLERCVIMYEELPDWMQRPVKAKNAHKLQFKNGSVIKSKASGKQSGRSIAGSLLILDEAAFIEHIDTIWAAVYPIISCVTKDTLILTSEGYRKIGDYFDNQKEGEFFDLDFDVYGRDGLEKVTNGYVSPKAKTKIITTRKGFKLEVTENHPLWKLTNDIGEMTPAQDLSVGDYLRISYGMEVYGNKQLNDDLAYMLGGYIAEGYITQNNSIWVANTDSEFRNVFFRNGFKQSTSYFHKLRLGSKKTVQEWIKLGINPSLKSFNKEIPRVIFESDKNTQKAFLTGLFDGDGSISITGEIVYTTTSSKLANQLQLLLLNSGIITRVFRIPKEYIMTWSKGKLLPQGKPLQAAHDCYKVIINRSQALKFKEIAGFTIPEKSYRLDSVIQLNYSDKKIATVPKSFVYNTLYEIIKKTNKSLGWFRKHKIRLDKLLDINQDRDVTINLIRRLDDILKSDFKEIREEYDFFLDEFTSNNFYDDIVSIEDSENETVDLTVPGTSSFLQNGILGSNTGGRVFALSTVNGVGNWFHEKYTEAKHGLNSFNAIDIKWQDHPEYKRHPGYEHLYEEMMKRTPPMNIDDWEKITKGNMSPREWLQEYECEFLGTGDTYIDGEILKQLNEQICREFKLELGHRLRIFEQPYHVYEYLVSVDVSLGRGLDYSAFHVINIYNGKQVAEFYSNQTHINDLAKIVANIGRRYNNAYVIIERNALGLVLIDKMFNFYEYENLVMDEKQEFGIQVTTGNRDKLLAIMEEFIRMRHIKLNSERTINELNTFIINDSGKAEADENMNDDLVMALAIGCYSMKELLSSTPIEHTHEISEFHLPENPIQNSLFGDSRTESEKDLYKWLIK